MAPSEDFLPWRPFSCVKREEEQGSTSLNQMDSDSIMTSHNLSAYHGDIRIVNAAKKYSRGTVNRMWVWGEVLRPTFLKTNDEGRNFDKEEVNLGPAGCLSLRRLLHHRDEKMSISKSFFIVDLCKVPIEKMEHTGINIKSSLILIIKIISMFPNITR